MVKTGEILKHGMVGVYTHALWHEKSKGMVNFDSRNFNLGIKLVPYPFKVLK